MDECNSLNGTVTDCAVDMSAELECGRVVDGSATELEGCVSAISQWECSTMPTPPAACDVTVQVESAKDSSAAPLTKQLLNVQGDEDETLGED